MSKGYVDFGYGEASDQKITVNGELLASLGFTIDEIEEDKDRKVTDAFYEAGGSKDHSGYSWGCMTSVACVLVENGWKTVDEIPEDDPLFKRIRTYTPEPA